MVGYKYKATGEKICNDMATYSDNIEPGNGVY